ncbi:peptidoglycan biosynthesis protein MviN/MurJ (putative lipid II flippase) [Streptacidiphilus sp. MAP12-33]
MIRIRTVTRLGDRFDWRGTGLGRSVAAARWTLLFVLANQVALAVVTRFANAQDATRAGAGSVAYFFAQSLWLLPQSVVTVSLVTAMLPGLTRAVTERRIDDARADLSRALRGTGAAIVPAAFFFLAFGPQLAVLLFAYGSHHSTAPGPLGERRSCWSAGRSGSGRYGRWCGACPASAERIYFTSKTLAKLFPCTTPPPPPFRCAAPCGCGPPSGRGTAPP